MARRLSPHLRSRSHVARLLFVILGASLLSVTPCRLSVAHHGGSIGRVEGLSASSSSSMWTSISTSTSTLTSTSTATGAQGSKAMGLPRMRVRATLGLSVFDRLVVPRSVSTAVASPGTIVVHLLTLSVIYRLTPGAYLGASSPFGVVRIHPANASSTTETGNGDLYLFGGQDLMKLMAWPDGYRPSVSVVPHFGVIVPTGQYLPSHALSTEVLLGSQDGALSLVSYDTDASLGSGALSVRGGLDIDHALTRWLGWTAGANVNVPVTRTRGDRIWWPTDWMASFDLRAQPGGAFSADGTWWDGIFVRVGVDGRFSSHDEFAARVALSYQVESNTACDVRLRVPVYARAPSLALAESISAQAGCHVDLGGP